MKIIIDAMGGDNAPLEIVKGALLAQKRFGTDIVLTGDESAIREAARTCGANARQTFLQVTLPLCAGAILRAFLVVFVFALGNYEVPFLLGPTAPKTLPVLAFIEFQDPDIVNRCYSMALNGTTTLLCSLAAIAYFASIALRDRRQAGGVHA